MSPACMIFSRVEEAQMERKKASDFPQELLNLLDGYVHGGISRRESWTAPKNLRLAV